MTPNYKSRNTRSQKVLIKARELLSTPGTWCQGRLARDANGLGCQPKAPGAVRFCMMGAVMRYLPKKSHTEVLNTKNEVFDALALEIRRKFQVNVRGVTAWNDDEHRTVEDVLKIYDLVLETMKERRNQV